MSTELDYVLGLMLRTLESELGTKDKVWRAVVNAHVDQMERAPDEIQPLLQANFDRLIADRFGSPTKH